MQVAMMEAGLIPNTVDYFDVDTDPSGRFATWLLIAAGWCPPQQPPSTQGAWPTLSCANVLHRRLSSKQSMKAASLFMVRVPLHPCPVRHQVSGSKVDTTKQSRGLAIGVGMPSFCLHNLAYVGDFHTPNDLSLPAPYHS